MRGFFLFYFTLDYKMVLLKHMVEYLNQEFQFSGLNDYCPNGLQIEGKETINRIATAVSANLESIEKAIAFKADALIVHHGYFWKGEALTLTGSKYQRIFRLIQNEMALIAYHLPLDIHPMMGNNCQLAHLLEIPVEQMYDVGGIPKLLWTGFLKSPISGYDLSKLIERKLDRAPLHISAKDRPITKIAWCTGAAQNFFQEAIALGCDAYLTGEVSERTYYEAQEANIHFYACGHHATEKGGVQKLGQHLAEKFHLQHFFIDSNNPI